MYTYIFKERTVHTVFRRGIGRERGGKEGKENSNRPSAPNDSGNVHAATAQRSVDKEMDGVATLGFTTIKFVNET